MTDVPSSGTNASVAYLTGRLDRLGEVDLDIEPLVDAMAAVGISATVVDWNDTSVDWALFDAAIVRSPWDYHLDFGRWQRFLERTSLVVPFVNPAGVIAWNQDKRYLAELAAAGVAVVHTDFCDDSEAVRAVLARHGHFDVVVKPSISAGSRDTILAAASDPAVTAVADVIVSRGGAVMVQPAIPSVATAGEVSAVVFGGEISHWVHKAPLLARGGGLLNGTYSEEITRTDPSPERSDAVERILGVLAGVLRRRCGLSGALPYARIDTVTAVDGTHLLLEAELFEPSFFCGVEPEAAQRFAHMLRSHLVGR